MNAVPSSRRATWPPGSNASFARWRIALWIFPGLFLLLCFFYPLARILSLSFNPAALNIEALRIALDTLRFTLFQASLSTVLTFVLGLPAAILFARYKFWGRDLLRAISAIPFMLPTVVVAAAFNSLLGPRGWINLALPQPIPFVGSLGAILVAHVFYNTTIVIRVVGNALARLDPALERAARALGANSGRVWWHVILPIIRPSLLAAALLVFLFDFNSFGVILLLGSTKFSTLEVEIYLRVLKLPNLPLAALLAIIQLICTLTLSILYTFSIRRSTTQNAPRFLNQRPPRTSSEKFFVGACVSALLLFYCLPLAALPLRSIWRVDADRGQRGAVSYGFTTSYYSELFINRRDSLFYVPPIRAAAVSLSFAALTAVLSIALGLPAAIALSKPTRLDNFFDLLFILPLGASAVMLGLGFIISFGGALRWPLFIPIAHTLVALPFVIRVLQPALAGIPGRLRQAATVLGANPLQVVRYVDVPIVRRAILSAAAFAFTISLGEFGATLLLSRPDLPTMPVAIARFLTLPGGLNYGQAMAMSTILMAWTLIGILLIEHEDARLA